LPSKAVEKHQPVRPFAVALLAIGVVMMALAPRVFAGADTIVKSPADAERLQPVTEASPPANPAGELSSAGVESDQNSEEFPRPISLEPNIHFWVDVFTAYGERDFLIHDRDHLWKVYEVQHLPGFGPPSRDEVDDTTNYLRTKYTNILGRLGAGLPPADPDERRVAALFKGEPLSAYTLAASNLRVQQGLREQFETGLVRSRNYRVEMERIFVDEGLPPQLVNLANIESDFYTDAKSSAGAVGIWQFTRDTGKEYLRISRYHDDRFNPMAETRAAAELLRYNYDSLGSWPLAITAYNYGTGGMEEAAQLYGGDFGRIFSSYDGPRFGFASKNYYAEFLAAMQVYNYEDQYFPDLKYQETPPPEVVRTDFTPPPRRWLRRHGALHRIEHRSRHTHRRRFVASASPIAGEPHLEMVVETHHGPPHRHSERVRAIRARHTTRRQRHHHAIEA
jgi:hypothetical protein